MLLFALAFITMAQGRTPNEWQMYLQQAPTLADRLQKVSELSTKDDVLSTQWLIGALGDSEPNVRLASSASLNHRQSRTTFERLLDYIPSQTADGGWATAIQLSRYSEEKYRRLFISHWDENDHSRRQVITCALGMIHPTTEFWRFVRRSEDSDSHVRWEAAYALYRYGEKYQKVLTKLVGHKDAHVEEAAIIALRLQNAGAAKPVIAKKLQSADENVRKAAQDFMAKVAG